MKTFLAAVIGVVCLLSRVSGADVAAPDKVSVAPDFELRLAKAQACEEAGDFAGGILICNDLLSQFSARPDLGKAREMLQRLNQEKRAALPLSFAVETLAADRGEDRQVARKQLIEAGDVGAILLRKTVRTGPVKAALTAIEALQEIEDPKAPAVYVDRLKREKPGVLSQALCQALETRLLSLAPGDRGSLADPLGTLLEMVKNDDTLSRREVAGVLLRFLSESFDSQSQPFNELMKNPAAFDTLKDYMKRADASTNMEMAVWASTRLVAVGLANTTGLIGWWQLNEKGGRIAKDSTTNRSHGTLTGGPVWCPEVRGGALRFDGTTNQVVIKPDAFANVTNTFTMTLWVNPAAARLSATEANENVSGTSGQRYAIFPNCLLSGHAGVGISIGTNGISVCEHSDGYLPALAVYDAVLTNWTHVAVVYQNCQPKIWVNGSVVRTGLVSRMIVHPSQNLGDVSGYGYFAGMIRDVRIYNRALADKEIHALGFAGAFTP